MRDGDQVAKYFRMAHFAVAPPPPSHTRVTEGAEGGAEGGAKGGAKVFWVQYLGTCHLLISRLVSNLPRAGHPHPPTAQGRDGGAEYFALSAFLLRLQPRSRVFLRTPSAISSPFKLKAK